jgi:hypothetical protein
MAVGNLQMPVAPAPVATPAVATGSPWLTIAGLALLVVVGGFLRLYNLDAKSVSHVEMYVPGIRLPHGISVPEERLTLVKVVTSTLNSDTHPPGYYALMWVWTKSFGTSAWSIRLPSALLGTACIPLVFWLGYLTRQTMAGWIAAGLLAINGHQVFWSDVARMFTLACFLGLFATILLLLMIRQRHVSPSLQLTYVAVLLLGVSTHIFFWLIVGCHMLWTAGNAWGERQPMPGLLKLQLVAVILGSPLLAFAAYQNGNTLATLSSNILIYAREFLQFSFAFPLLGYSSGLFGDYGRIPDVDNPHLSLARWLFFLVSLVLFVAGSGTLRRSQASIARDTSGPSAKAWLWSGMFATLAILAFIWTARTFARPHEALQTTERMTIIPMLLAVTAVLVEGNWTRLSSWSSVVLRERLPAGDGALVLILATVPFLLLAFVSIFKPIFNARGLLPLAPYILLVLAAGIVRLGRNPLVLVTILVAVCAAHYSGLRAYRAVSAGRADYKSFAAALRPQIGRTDLVFLYPEFYSTPMFFYMNSNWDRVVARNYAAACGANPHARVWALWFDHYEPRLSSSMQQCLANYHIARVIQAEGGKAMLYVAE